MRDVVAHVLSCEGLRPRALVRRLAAGGLVPDRVNEVGVVELRSLPPRELVALMRRCAAPVGLTAGFGGRIALVDTLIHHQDVRRPLGMPRDVPTDRLWTALPFAYLAPPIRALWHSRGVRLVATDVDWAAGRGPEARGPAEAVLLTMAGRRGVARELTGPGAEVLVRRLA